MDEANLVHLLAMRPASSAAVPTLFLGLGAAGRSVPDPYYGGDQGFERVLDLLDEGCDALIAHLHLLMATA
jgi:protein-tyrosine phosphatase